MIDQQHCRVFNGKLILHGLEPGTVIMPSIYLAHHRKPVYPEPKQFRPERFLERQYSPYEYLPLVAAIVAALVPRLPYLR